ncbi:hypothetical protein Y032_0197g1595 [Ancylostoma ceylanicum]|uniref:Sushi domain protein n=1 Tax=Ancylostoma ceylanicum TaxID=53326 RepID=A0A016SNM5_9BILA|nr:hypothetical protein Y032_0197g1595 [Ancylostoma ceylanicum]
MVCWRSYRTGRHSMSLMLTLLILCICSAAATLHSCPHPNVPENGHIVFDGPSPYAPFTPNTVAKYSCAPGFDKVGGTDERICSPSGSWSGEAPVCAIDVAAGKPAVQSSGNSASSVSRGLCTISDNIQGSWWEVDLLGSYEVHGVSIRLGKQSSHILNIYLIQQNGELRQCDISAYSFVENATVFVICELDRVDKVRVVAESRLHLCEARVFATNAVSSWQCSQSMMDVLGIFEGLCYSASREERADWLGAQRKCLDRGATLPMKMSDISQRGLRAALAASPFQKEFYWIGVSSSLTDWRWADGTTVAEEDADWSNSKILTSNRPEAVVLARLAEWRWIPSAQNVWNSFLCQSKPKSCTFPGVGEAGRVSFSSQTFTIGSFSVYTCEEGYELEGDAERVCEESARWSGDIPRCRKKKCSNVDVWSGGGIVRLLNGTTEYGNEIEYECLSGWKLIGERRRWCQHDGSWSGFAPSCKVVDCERPPSIPNGSVSVALTIYGSVANYTCQDGYRLIGHATVSCGSKGVWEPAIPVCYDIATLRELKTDSAENHAGLAALIVVLGLLLVFAVLRFSRASKSVPICEKPAPPYGAPNVIYAIPSVITNPSDSVVYYAPSAPLTKMELPPHLVSLKPLPSGHFQATMPIGRPLIRPQLPIFAPSPTPSQLLYSFDYEPIYDVPPDVGGKPESPEEENIYEKLPDIRPNL